MNAIEIKAYEIGIKEAHELLTRTDLVIDKRRAEIAPKKK